MGQNALGHGFMHAFFHRWDIRFGDGTADDAVFKFKAPTPGQWRYFQPSVAKLTAAAT